MPPYRLQPHSLPWISPRYLWSGHKISADDPITQDQSSIKPGVDSEDSRLSAKGINLAARMSSDRKFQCTQFDKKGDICMGHGHIQKSELVSKVSATLSPR